MKKLFSDAPGSYKEIEKTPAETLTEAIRHIRRTHMNTYSWSLPISDEEAIDLLSNKIVEVESN